MPVLRGLDVQHGVLKLQVQILGRAAPQRHYLDENAAGSSKQQSISNSRWFVCLPDGCRPRIGLDLSLRSWMALRGVAVDSGEESSVGLSSAAAG